MFEIIQPENNIINCSILETCLSVSVHVTEERVQGLKFDTVGTGQSIRACCNTVFQFLTFCETVVPVGVQQQRVSYKKWRIVDICVMLL